MWMAGTWEKYEGVPLFNSSLALSRNLQMINKEVQATKVMSEN